MEHTEECLAEQKRIADALHRFEIKYPRYCRSCNATGYHNYDEDVAGDGGSRMQMCDPCDDCLGKGKCPLCGLDNILAHCILEEVFDENSEAEVCPKCPWTWVGESVAYVAPQLMEECGCGEEEE